MTVNVSKNVSGRKVSTGLKMLSIIIPLLLLFVNSVMATVTVTAGTGGTSICTNKALDGSAPGTTTLGTITVKEAVITDFSAGADTMTIVPPAGWQFGTTAPTFTFTAARDITSVTLVSISGSALKLYIVTSGVAKKDAFKIVGLQVQAISGRVSTASSNITASATTGFNGPTIGTTRFAALSQSPLLLTGATLVCPTSTITLADATSGGTWTTGNAAIASVNASGVVLGVATGTTNITYNVSGCTTFLTVTVNSTPSAVSVSGTTPACDATTITATGGTGGTTYYQGTTSNGTSTATPSTSENITTSGTYYFRAQNTSGCWGTQGSIVVTINASPAAISGAGTVCTGANTTLTDATGSGTWTSSNTAIATINSSTGSMGGVAQGTTIITYMVTATGCYTTKTTTTITGPSGISGMSNMCPQQTGTFTNTSNYGTWSSSNTGVATVVAASGFVTAVAGGTAIITYSTGCSSVATFTLSVNNGSISGGTTPVCTGSNTTLTGSPTLGAWSSSNTGIATVGAASGIVGGVATGTAVITYVISSCNVTKTVSITTTPVAITGTLSACAGGTSQLTDTRPFGTWSSSNTSIATVDGTGLVSAVAAGTAIISYSTGCNSAATVSFTVNPIPSAISGTLTVCAGLTTSLSDAGGGTWSSSNTSVATINSGGVTGGAGAGTATITYTLGTGCLTTKVVTVNPSPAAITGTAAVCQGLITTLADATAGGTWSSTNTAKATVNSTTGDVTGVAAGTSVISYSLAAGCSATSTVTVNVTPSAVTVTGGGTFCDSTLITASGGTGGTIYFQDDITGGTDMSDAGNPQTVYSTDVYYFRAVSPAGCWSTEGSTVATINYTPDSIAGNTTICVGSNTILSSADAGGTWNSSSTAIATVGAGSGLMGGKAQGTATITYTLTGCATSISVTVNALPAPIGGNTPMCASGSTITLTQTSRGGNWSGGTAGIATVGTGSGIVTPGATQGTATISYANGCGSAATAVVTVNATPTAVTGTTTVCVGSTVTLSNTASGGSWSSSNTAKATVGTGTGIVNGVSQGTTTITYANNCGSVTTVVTINASPAPIGGNTPMCTSGSTITLTQTSTGGSWSGGTAGIATVGTGTGVVTPGATQGTATITYSGCSSAAITVVTVNAIPSSITGTAIVCVGATTALTSNAGGGTWSSSNTAVATAGSASGIVTGVAQGTATMTYTNNCGNTTRVVTVNATPAGIAGNAAFCVGSNITLTNTSTGGTWISSNTAVATAGSTTGVINGIAAGTTLITYTNSCTSIATVVATVNAVPSSTGATNNGPICATGTVTLSANSANATAWSWTGPAGYTSSLQTPTATPTITGTYSLTVSSAGAGCSPATVYTTTVTVKPTPAAAPANNGPVCASGTVTLTANSTNATAWNWTGPDGFTSAVQNPTATPTVTGTYSLSVSSAGSGCSPATAYTTTVTVNPTPAAAPTNSGPICASGTVTLFANSTNATAWHWNGPGGFTSAVQNPTATPTVTGTYSLTVSATGSGCNPATVYTTTVTVNPVPAAAPTNNGPICATGTVTLTANSSNATAWSWSGPGGFASAMQNPTATPTVTSTYSLTVSAAGSGCSPATVYTTTVTVSPLPAAAPTNNGPICAGSTVTFTANPSASVTSYAWSGPGSFTSTAANPATVPTATGTYSLTVSGGTASGCSPSTVYTTTVTVNAVPSVITGVNAICIGSTTTLADTVTGGTWTSSNTSVATVAASTGTVTAVSSGTTTITYSLTGGCKATRTVSVISTPPAIGGTPEACIGYTSLLTDIGAGVWISADPSVAIIGSSTGIVTGISAGYALISYVLPCGVATTYFTVDASAVNPVISSVSPQAGHPLTAVTISGTDFDATTTNNIVYFGATRATVTSASWSSLNVQVPVDATASPVSVETSGCGLIGYSRLPFIPNYDNSAYTAGNLNFDAAANFTTGSSPYNVVIGDLDGDGKSDLVVTNLSDNTISVYRNTSTTGTLNSSSFATKVDFATGTQPYNVAIGDLDGDGKPELVTANIVSNNVSVLRNTSVPGVINSGSFAAKVDFTTGVNPVYVAFADVDMDGKSDLVTANFFSNTISVLRNTTSPGAISSSSFASKVDFATGSHPYSVATGDLDGDGKPEIVIPNQGANTVSVFYNTSSYGSISSYSLASKVDFATGTQPVNAAVWDIDGDGKLDIAVANSITRTISVYRNISTMGSFTSASLAAKVDIIAGVLPFSIAIGDMDGDGKPDMLVSHQGNARAGTTAISIFLNSATSGSITTGSFAAPKDVVMPSSPRYVAVGDLDGDQRPDLAVALIGSNQVATLRYNTSQPITGTTSVCGLGSTIALSDLTTGGTWTSSNTGVATVGAGTGVVTAVGAGTTTITYSISSGDKVTTTVTVTATPGAIAGTTGMCIGATTTLTDAGSGVWTSSTTSVAIVGSASGVVSGVNSGTSVITYTTGPGCASTTVVTVNPAAITGASAICSGSTTTLTDIGGGTWASSNTSVAPVGVSSGVVSGVSTGTSIITYALAGCSATLTVTVVASPGATTGPSFTCVGGNMTLSNTGSGTWSSSNTGVATVGAATGIVGGVAAGSVTITYSLGTGCYATSVININAMPGAITGTATVCQGFTTTLADAATGGTWSSASTAIASVSSASGVVTGVAAGSTTITYAKGTGCVVTRQLTVNAAPAAITGTTDVCAGSATTLADATGSGTWGSSNTTIATTDATTGAVNGVAAGTATITYTASGCIATTTVNVNPLPSAVSGSANTCVGSTTLLTDGGGGEWASSDASIADIGSTTGLVSGISSGIATITYTLPTGCTITIDVTVNVVPSAISGSSTLCAGTNTALYNPDAGAWSSSNTAIATVDAGGTLYAVTSGTATITFTAGTGCTATMDIVVNSLPDAITGSTSVCTGSTAALSSTTPGGEWTSSNVSVATVDFTTGTVGGINPGTATIVYGLSATGCTTETTVTVNATPSAISGSLIVCEGATTTLAVTSGGTWSSSNTAVASIDITSGVATGIAAGTATVTFATSSGCYTTGAITVNPAPSAITGVSAVCEGSATTLSDASPAGTWSSSNTSVATADASLGIVTGVAAGTATIYYTVGSSCPAVFTMTVQPKPAAIVGTTVLCEGSSATLTDATGGGTWSSSNIHGAVVGSTTGVVSAITMGTTTITYMVATGCYNTTTTTINLLPSGIGGGPSVCQGATITLTDAISGGAWTSSNTSIATIDTTGLLSGVAAGVTNITYTLATGCQTSTAITVNALPAAISGSLYVCSGLTTALNDANPGGTWSSNNTAVASIGSSSGIVTGVSTGTATVTYTLPCGYTTAVITVGGVAAGVPTVTSVSPLMGYPASSVTITGTNFNSVTTNNIVYFGATRATVSVASTTSLTVAVPAGATYMPVSVDNTGCALIAYAAYPFLPTYNNSAYIAGTLNFAARVDYTSGASPYTVAIGDIDGDGKADLAVSNISANTVSVFRNTSTSGMINSGSFATKVDFTTGSTPYSVVLGDVDGDGKLDMVVGNEVANTISVLRNTATSGTINAASFATKVDFATGVNPISVAITDVDADGKPDIISANFYSNTMSVLRNTVTSGITATSFAAKVDFATGSHPYSVAVTDLDGDGKPDVAIANQGSATVSVFRNTATSGTVTTASFAAKVDFATGANPYHVATGDIDGDGKQDLVVTNNGANSISVLRNTATTGSITSGSFAAKVDFTTGSTPYNASLGDVDGNGKVDIAVANAGSNTVSVFRNLSASGSISLAAKVDFATGTSPRSVAVGDFDGDGIPDMAVANLTANSISVLRNNPLAASTGTTTLCAGSTSTLSNTTSGGTWSSGNTSVATAGSSTGVVYGVAPGTASITYTLPGGSVTTTVTVTTGPAALTGTASVCPGSATTLASTTPGGAWSSSNTAIATVTSGSVTGVSAGTATITYSTGASCNVLKTITVNALPAAIAGTASVCAGNTVTLSDATSGGTWTSSNTSVGTAGASTGTISGIAAGTTTITYMLGTGCYNTAVFTVKATPAAITGTTGVCVGGTATLADATSGGTWSSSNTGIASVNSSTGFMTGVAAGTATITYTSATGCIALTTVAVNTSPGAITGTTSLCAGSTATLSNSATGGTWSSSNTAVVSAGASTGVITGVTSGTAIITYSVGPSCAATTVITVSGAPTISALSVSAGYPGSSVTITGTGFNTTAASNIVYFGATKATVSSASSTSMTVTVPSGATYMPVTVDNASCNLTAYSQYPYLPTYDNSAYYSGSINYSAKVDFSTSSNPYGIAVGDLDGDGKADIATVNLSSNSVSIFRNTSSGTISTSSFAAKFDLTTGASPYGIAIGDIDGDGKLDLAITNNSSNTISVIRNQATSGTLNSASFAAKVDFATGTNPMSVAIGDLDGDGKADLVSANFYSNTISVLRNISVSGAITTGSMAAKVDFATGTHPYSVALGDIDGDGKADIVAANQGSASVSVFRNTATAGSVTTSSFAAKVDFTTGSNPYSAAIGDIDGDGKMDIVVANNAANTISVLRNTATSGSITSGSLAAKVDFATGSSPYYVAMGDIDGDGKVDIVVPNATAGNVSVLRNTATSGSITSGSLAASINFITGSSPRCVAIGDLNGDNMPDIAVANLVSNTVSVLQNSPVAHPAAGHSSMSSVTLCVGSMVALNDTATGTYSSTNANIAVVDALTGVVTAVAPGRAAIVFNSATAMNVTNIIVNALPGGVTVTVYPGTTVAQGQAVTFTATVQNEAALPAYQWQVNGKNIAGATGSKYEAGSIADNEVVTCVAGSSTGCSDYAVTASVIMHTTASDAAVTLTAENIKLFPNPSNGTFAVKGTTGSATSEEVTIEVVNMLGQVLYRSAAVATDGNITEQVKLGNVANGMYIVNVHRMNEVKSFHIMISK